jgi:hypothetical protein
VAIALIAARGTQEKTRSALALWHLLSLDAPAVAAVWTMYVARCFNVTLPWSATAALAIAVWMLYAADRLADAARGTNLRQRHHFHQLHRHAFLGGMVGAVPVLILLLVMMPPLLRMAWMLQALPLAFYVAAVHAWQLPRVPKEHLVGIFFAVTCFMPALLSQWSPAAVAGLLLFGTLCWLNCAALARWEGSPSTTLDTGTAWAAQHLRMACFFLSAIAALTLLLWHRPWIVSAVVLGCFALSLLDGMQRRMKPIHLRALADAALLTPLLLWPVLHIASR